MDFSLDPAEEEILKTSRQFAQRLRERQRIFEEEGVDPETVKIWEDLGLELLDLPEAWGGAGLPLWLKMMTLEELSYGCAGATLALHPRALVLKILSLLENPPQELSDWARKSHGPLAFAVDDDQRIEVVGGRVRGNLPFVLHRHPEGILLLSGHELVAFSPGECALACPGGIQACGGVRVNCADLPCIVTKILPEERMRIVTILRLWQGALLAGIAQASYEYVRAYTLERETFGRKIAYHQAIAFRIAEMHITVEAVKLAVLRAAYAAEAEPAEGFYLSQQAFLFAHEAVIPLTITGVQFLGGHGFVRDHPVEKWMRDARACASLFGGPLLAEEEMTTHSLERLALQPVAAVHP